VTELLERPADPNADYVMTEVVHCKSRREIGVAAASDHCASMHLDRILTLTTAPLVIVLGAKARDRVRDMWRLPDGFGTRRTVAHVEQANLAVRALGGRPRVIAFLWHPTGMEKPRNVMGSYPTMFRALQGLVQGNLSPEVFLAGGYRSCTM
jgi:hypothetical protein